MAINISGGDIAYMQSIGYKIVPRPESTSLTPPGTVWMERDLSLPYNPPPPSNNPSSAWEIKPATTTTTMPNQPSNLNAIQNEINRIAQEVGKITTGVTQLTGKSITTGTPANTLKLPEYQQYTGNINNSLGSQSFYKQFIADEEARQKEYQAALLKAQEVQATKPKSFLDYLKNIGKQTPEEYATTKYAETGYTPSAYFASQKARIAELDTLSQQYNAKELEKNKAIEANRNLMAPMTFISGREAKIQRQYNIELSAMAANIQSKSAIMEMEQGNFNQAQNFVNQTVSNYTWTLQTDLAMLQDFYNDNQQLINSLDTKLQNSLNRIIALKQDEYNEIKAEKQAVLNLMLQSPNAGITVDDTLQSATEKAAKVVPTPKPDIFGGAEGYYQQVWNPKTRQWEVKPVAGMGGKGITTPIGSFTDIMQATIDADGTPEQAAREAAIASANMGISVNQKQLNEWTEQARKMTKTPITPTITPLPPTSAEIGRQFPAAFAETFTAPGRAVGNFYENLFGFVGGMFNQ